MPDESAGSPPRHVGIGDRWLAGERLDGVRYNARDEVEVLIGKREGERGVVLLLIAIEPEPAYLVEIRAARVRLLQSALRPA